MNKIIEMVNVNKQFKEHLVLKDINLEIRQGEFFGFLGPSGAGKTTTIKILTGQIKKFNGSARILNQNVTNINHNLYSKIGVITDNSGVFKELSIYENLRIFANIHKIPKDRIDFLLNRVGLNNVKKKKAGKLSKGMLQRLIIARALLNEPALLFLDEPTSGLDPKTTKDIHRLLLEEKEKGMTLFLTTHNMYEAEILCDKLALLDNGQIIEHDSPQELIRKYHTKPEIKITYKNGEQKIITANKNNQENFFSKNILTIHSNEPNLEDIFLFLTGKELN